MTPIRGAKAAALSLSLPPSESGSFSLFLGSWNEASSCMVSLVDPTSSVASSSKSVLGLLAKDVSLNFCGTWMSGPYEGLLATNCWNCIGYFFSIELLLRWCFVTGFFSLLFNSAFIFASRKYATFLVFSSFRLSLRCCSVESRFAAFSWNFPFLSVANTLSFHNFFRWWCPENYRSAINSSSLTNICIFSGASFLAQRLVRNASDR